MTLRGGGCLVVPCMSIWLLGCTAGALFVDGVMAYAAYQQVCTQWFPTTQGTILYSAVDVEQDDETTSYSVQVKYVYEVAGREYQSERLRFQRVSTSWQWTKARVAALPEGQPVVVYYDPTQPANAVLMPGVVLADLLPSIVLIPFNMVLAGVWAAMVYVARSGGAVGALPAGTRVLSGPHGQIVRLPGYSPAVAAGATSGGMAFILIFVLVLGFEMDGPPWPAMVAWVLIVGAGVAGAWWAIRDHASGQYDLLIDGANRAVALPARRTEFESPDWRATVDLRGADVISQTAKDRHGEKITKYVTQFITADDRRLDVYRFSNETDALSLAVWLANRLQLRPPSPQ